MNKFFLFRFLLVTEKDMKKRTKGTSKSPLFIGVTARFARVGESEKSMVRR